ncbi:MAG: cytochrome o ubiquinol oxidase subunit IV [Pseudomonadota bacterium]
MSAASHHHDDLVHGHDHHDHSHDEGMPHVSLKGYMTGFILSVILTAIPFWLVMAKVIPDNKVTAVVVVGFAVVQLLVHMVYFLHLDTTSEGGWNMLALIFTAMLLVIMFAGSLWVMYHMNTNMMPVSVEDMRNMP